jgi:hypothetical protein
MRSVVEECSGTYVDRRTFGDYVVMVVTQGGLELYSLCQKLQDLFLTKRNQCESA